MYGTFSLIRYSTTRSHPRISAMDSPSVAVPRLYDASEDLGRLADALLEGRQRRIEPRRRELVRERERILVVGDLRAGHLVLYEAGEVGDRGRRPADRERERPG